MFEFHDRVRMSPVNYRQANKQVILDAAKGCLALFDAMDVPENLECQHGG